MKKAIDYYEELESVDEFSLLRLISEVQKEAWNESTILAESSAEVSFDSDMSGRHYHVSKQSILKNLIP